MYQFLTDLNVQSLARLQKNPLTILIGTWKSIEFHLTHYEIPQTSSCYYTVNNVKLKKWKNKLNNPPFSGI